MCFLTAHFLSIASLERQPNQTYRDDSDAATFKQSLPDLTPDEPSEALSFPAFGKDEGKCDTDLAPSQPECPAETQEPQLQAGKEPVTPLAEEGAAAAADAGSDESPGKSPSKKKKKFRTPSFLKKSKKKTES